MQISEFIAFVAFCGIHVYTEMFAIVSSTTTYIQKFHCTVITLNSELYISDIYLDCDCGRLKVKLGCLIADNNADSSIG